MCKAIQFGSTLLKASWSTLLSFKHRAAKQHGLGGKRERITFVYRRKLVRRK